jgi:demethylmenaquinone methyltransferase / 2-methoxy-6-polyprenyl-1,4-benzoquinol methylase
MASVELSLRVEKVVGYAPLSEMSDSQRHELQEALLDASAFEDLPGKWQAAILKAEQARPSVTAASPRKQHALELFSGLPDRYDRIGAVLSFGQDPRWRQALVASTGASSDDRVLDVATGTGLVAEALVRRYGCSVVGLDQSEAMLAGARRRIAASPDLAAQIELVHGEAEELPFEDARFDAVTFTYLLRYVDDPAATMRELARVLKPGGRMASLEFGVPQSRVPRAMWRAYTRVGLPAIGRLVSREWYEVGSFLGPSISDFQERYPDPVLRRLWAHAGIQVLGIRRMSFGAGVVVWGVSEGAHGA